MNALLLERVVQLPDSRTPLRLVSLPVPHPGPGEVLIRVLTCGVCRTELDEIEGRTPPPRYPIVPGHQVVGTVEATGEGVRPVSPGTRVGVGWIFSSCGRCDACAHGLENLCPAYVATGRDVHGGYAEYMVAREDFVSPIPDALTAAQAAPMLCAGAIGFRSIALSGLQDGDTLGLTGFGASAHLVLKLVLALFPRSRVVVFTRSVAEQEFARSLGAAWAGGIGDTPPVQPRAIIDTTPAWGPVIDALEVLAPGGRLVINAIRKEARDKEALNRLDYTRHLWLEKEVTSVANVTREDIRGFLGIAAESGVLPEIQEYPLHEANVALLDLKEGRIRGAKVLRVREE